MRGTAVRFALAATALTLLVAAPASASIVKSGGLSYASKPVQVKPHKYVRYIVACPKHTEVVGGGMLSHTSFGTNVVHQTFPADLADKDTTPDDGWGVVVANTSKDKAPMTVTAVCGKTKVRYAKNRTHLSGGAVAGEHDVACPQGLFAYSGGVAAPSMKALILEGEFPYSSSTGSTKWGAYYKSSKALDATSYSVCGALEPEEVSASIQMIPAGTEQGADVNCPAGTRAYGGGVATSATYPGVTINSVEPLFPVAGGVNNGSFAGFMDFTATYQPEMSVTAMCGPTLN